ncbi:MAG: flavodoxin-dependent (E)-4-hydroxy-3-methylbut-2-enyl-diphosphate synthase, partial [Kordiimonadaceae bacterium]|nr:flavodoxin-dependent (E)-4-hydroxy-3-methylbut-2-enyl-diphosphate synthase [Kordiimonadaceae bacterium]
MSLRPYRDIIRRKCRQIMVGDIPVGGDAPISVQSMTNTLTTDVAGTVAQIHALENAGADIVRVSCPDEGSTKALKEIIDNVSVPI